MVGKGLTQLHPSVDIRFKWIESRGDQVTDRALAGEGGKGLFTTAVERAVLDGHADVAVHSFKDVPVRPTPGLALAATPRRADVRDCLIPRDPNVRSLDDLPEAAVVGTSSPRRAAQVKRRRPDLDIRLIRGNVETRLSKVIGDPDSADDAPPPLYDATLLAVAGLTRLRLQQHADRPIDPDLMLPAASQAALALYCRTDDHVTLTRCLPLNNAATSTAVHAERRLVELLAGDCDSSIAALAEPTAPPTGEAHRNADAHWFRFRGRVFAPDGSTVLEADHTVRTRELPRLVKRIAADFDQRGARDLLAQARHQSVIAPPPQPASPPHPAPADTPYR